MMHESQAKYIEYTHNWNPKKPIIMVGNQPKYILKCNLRKLSLVIENLNLPLEKETIAQRKSML